MPKEAIQLKRPADGFSIFSSVLFFFQKLNELEKMQDLQWKGDLCPKHNGNEFGSEYKECVPCMPHVQIRRQELRPAGSVLNLQKEWQDTLVINIALPGPDIIKKYDTVLVESSDIPKDSSLYCCVDNRVKRLKQYLCSAI